MPTGAATCSAGVNPTVTCTSCARARRPSPAPARRPPARRSRSRSSTAVPLPEAPNVLDRDRRVDPARPAEARRRLDGDLQHVRRQHRLAVLLALLLEELPARHRDDTRRDALLGEQVARLERRRHLGAGRDEHHVGRVDVREHVGAPAQARGRRRTSCGRASARSGGRARGTPGPGPPRGSSPTSRTHSFASAGRITVSCGIARIAARCSTGWWVGPSSPTATESW